MARALISSLSRIPPHWTRNQISQRTGVQQKRRLIAISLSVAPFSPSAPADARCTLLNYFPSRTQTATLDLKSHHIKWPCSTECAYWEFSLLLECTRVAAIHSDYLTSRAPPTFQRKCKHEKNLSVCSGASLTQSIFIHSRGCRAQEQRSCFY